jgi:hypothetical protein
MGVGMLGMVMLERQVQAFSLGLLGPNSALSRSTFGRANSKERPNHVSWEAAPK